MPECGQTGSNQVYFLFTDYPPRVLLCGIERRVATRTVMAFCGTDRAPCNFPECRFSVSPVQAVNQMIGCSPMNYGVWRLNVLFVLATATIASPVLRSQSLPLVNGYRVI
jgi:hypothetical protein